MTLGGELQLQGGSTFAVAGSFVGPGILLGGGSVLDLSASVAALDAGFTTALTLGGKTAMIDLQSVSNTATLSSFANGTLEIISGGSTLDLHFNAAPGMTLASFAPSDDGSGNLLLSVACYVRGTRIATPSGEMPIEALRIGDPVLSAGGAVRPIRWIGRRLHDAAATLAERSVRPIRIRAGALSDGLPRRDLFVSPEHALLLHDDGGVLVPASALVNGDSIARMPGGSEVEYFHIELKLHDAIRAEGQPAETFVDDDSRAMFDNAAEFAALYPKHVAAAAQFCAPRITSGPVLARLRSRIDARAGLLAGELHGHLDIVEPGMLAGWALDPSHPHRPVLLELLVDGKVVQTGLADRHRADLAEVTESGGYCGFILDLPAGFGTDRRHVVTIRRAEDGAELRGSPVLVDFLETHDLKSFTGPAAPVLPAPVDAAARVRFLNAQIDRIRAQRAA